MLLGYKLVAPAGIDRGLALRAGPLLLTQVQFRYAFGI
jgi:hypothetical protein